MPERPRRPTMAALSGALLALAGWILAMRGLDDNSFLTHLRTGHWILGHGIPRADIYSFTAPGTGWVAQSWLAEIVYAGLDRAVGPFGIQVLNAATGGLIGFVVFRLTARLVPDRLRAMALALVTLITSAMLWAPRPLLLGLLALLALIWVVEVPDSGPGRRPLIWVPLLCWLWVNIHGTFALGFGYLCLHLAGQWLDGSAPWHGRERRLAQAALAGFAVCFANPYGFGLVVFPFRLMLRGGALSNVLEWGSPDLRHAPGIVFALWIALVIALLARSRSQPSRRDLLVLICFLILGLWAVRNIGIAALVGLPVLARTWSRSAPRPDNPPAFNWVALSVLLLVGVAGTARAADRPSFDDYPVRALQVVEQRGLLGGRLLTTDRWAGYVIHAYWPRQHVFMDDRFDMYPLPLIRDYNQFLAGDGDVLASLDRYRITAVAWPAGDPLPEILKRALSWQRIYEDELAIVYTRI